MAILESFAVVSQPTNSSPRVCSLESVGILASPSTSRAIMVRYSIYQRGSKDQKFVTGDSSFLSAKVPQTLHLPHFLRRKKDYSALRCRVRTSEQSYRRQATRGSPKSGPDCKPIFVRSEIRLNVYRMTELSPKLYRHILSRRSDLIRQVRWKMRPLNPILSFPAVKHHA